MRRALRLLLAACLLPVLTAGPAEAAVADPTLTPVPANAGKGWAASGAKGVIDLAARGYVEEEYLMSGTANTYEQVGAWTEDGRWNMRVATTGNPYTTRMLVARPSNPAKFNGTVVIEWLNVSFGVDIPVDLSQSHEHFLRSGAVVVGLTTQKGGADKLKSLDPGRYSGVNLSADTLSYDIFSQAARAVRAHPEVLGGRTPEVVLGTGHSQSALRLTTYANAVQPVDGVYDGLMLHGRAALAAPIGDGVIGALSAKIRTDLKEPVFVLQAETDVVFSSSVRQNTARVRTWEIAGTAHADQYGLDQYNAANARDKGINGGAPTYCDKPVNAMTFRYASNAAFDHLDRWARGGVAPPVASPILMLGPIILRDSDQNALGGVRLPDFDVPVATYGPNNSGGNVPGACGLLGTTTPFTAERLGELYPDHDVYVEKFVEAAGKALDGGYLLKADYEEAVDRVS
ncbi:alpha/beta hydrolase domain-containing protein [Amycolatopsis sp. YIM 10]|uniref:alpha/beta hydrolase domain-containing protein n=1 Tax=Amycolatopsis sp. YIM 10 TaxID=2653857 RepID=UPI00129037E6|nr:alpha/beta hydrolase domain-containing protein [Amycolatopsis sp. YIM 10]QFU91886.1 hypothetical protein YIM_33625 [Amycolatopsis sp. YIM 10]